MEARKTTLERAFELARTGRFRSLEDLRGALRREEYSPHQINGPTLTRQLREIIQLARLK